MSKSVDSNQPNSAGKSAGARSCFVMMPFSTDFDAIYENSIRPAVSSFPNLACVRADEIYGPRPIMEDVWRSISTAYFLVADLSGRNPNVMYELGLAHAIQKPVILVSQEISDIPFDLRAIRCLVYSNNRTGRATLADQLVETIQRLLTDLRGGRKRADYVVLNARSGGQRIEDISFAYDTGQDAPSILVALRQYSERLKLTKSKKVVTQPPLDKVAELLKNDAIELRLEAIKFLREHGRQTHSPLVRPLLDDPSPIVQKAALDFIADHIDEHSELLLWNLLEKNLPDTFRTGIHVALAAHGQAETRRRCKTLLSRPKDESPRWLDAIQIACHSLDDGEYLPLIERSGYIDQASRPELIELLDALCSLERFVFRDPETRDSLLSLLQRFSDNPNPQIRARIAYLMIMFTRFSRLPLPAGTTGWTLMNGCGREAIMEFLRMLSRERDDESLLSSADGMRLIEMVQGDALLEEDIVYTLHDLKTPGAHDFLLRFLDPSEDAALWALSYFADMPHEAAVDRCRAIVINTTVDVSSRVLGALCLAKLGDEKMKQFVCLNASKAHSWVLKTAKAFAGDEVVEDKPAKKSDA